MAVEREASQEEMSSFASLLKTFLPDHNDLPLMGSTDELLEHVKGSIKHNPKQAVGKGGQSQCDDPAKKHRQLLDSMKGISSKPAEGNFSDSGIEFPGHFHSKMQEQLASNSHYNSADEQYSSLKVHFGITQHDPAQQSVGDGRSEVNRHLTNNCSYDVKLEYDSDATQDVLDVPEVNNSYLPREDNFGKDYVMASSSSGSCPSGVKQYACFVCDETFQDLMLYTFHMQGHQYKAGNIKCNDCTEMFENNSVFFAHRKLSTYELWVDRTKVINAQHEVVTEEPEKIDSSPKPKKKRKGREDSYICSVCGKVIPKYSSFLKHIATHENIMALSCGVCQEPFRAPCLLRYHIDLHHSHVQPFQCRRCLRRFKLKCSLSTHMRYCDVDPSSLPFAEEMQYIDQLSQQRSLSLHTDNSISAPVSSHRSHKENLSTVHKLRSTESTKG